MNHVRALALKILFTILIICAAEGDRTARAQTVEQFYSGRTITMFVGVAPGGLNDVAARLVSRHFGRFIPGEPRFVVQNLPGVGSIVLTNRLMSLFERNGSVLAMVDRGAAQLAVQGEAQVKYDPQALTWLGSLSSYANDAYFLAVNASSAIKSVDDLRKPMTTMQVGAVPGATNHTFALLARDVLSLNINVIRGYANSPAIFLATERGELDGNVTSLSSVRVGQRALWEAGKIRPLVQFGRMTRHPDLANVPTARELTSDPDVLALIEFAELPFLMALPFVAPPDIPADRARALRDGFMAMTKDMAFLEDAEKLRMEISPVDAKALGELIRRSNSTPKSVIERYNQLFAEK